MGEHKNQNKKKNSGFTLIEMIVTVAIIAIFSGVVLSLITSSSSSYRNTSSNSKVQMETQETFDKIEDMIINANRNLYYFTADKKAISNDIKEKGSGDSSGGKIFMVSSGDDEDIASQTEDDENNVAVMSANVDGTEGSALRSNDNTAATLKNEKDRQCIVWNKSTGEIKYIHYVKIGNTWKSEQQDEMILATGVLDFRADISKAFSDKIVRFQLTTQNGNKKIETLHSVSLRNELGISEQIDIDPDIDPVEPTPESTITPTQGATPTLMPTSLSPSVDSLLIGAGTSLDLSKVVKWTLHYDDGTQKQSGLELSWRLSSCNFAYISNEGVIKIYSDAGTSDTGEIGVIIKEQKSGVEGEIKVRVARVDIVAPKKNEKYFIGDEKKLLCEYREGGNVNTEVKPTITILNAPSGQTEYLSGYFSKKDVGIWKIKAEVNLETQRRGYGAVNDICDFHVKENTSNNIILNGDRNVNTVVAGQSYACSPGSSWGFKFEPYEGNYQNAVIEWSLKGDPDGVSITPVNSAADINGMSETGWVHPGMSAVLTVDKVKNTEENNNDLHPSGFILCADYKRYSADGTLIVQVHDEMAVNVAYGLKLEGEGDSTNYNKKYYMSLKLKCASYDKSTYDRVLIGQDLKGYYVDLKWGNVQAEQDKWWYKVSQIWGDDPIIITFSVWGIKDVFFNDTTTGPYGVQLNSSISVKVNKHE